MSRKLIEAIAEAIRESDVELRNDIEPFDYYEVKAEAAVRAYETFETAPASASLLRGGGAVRMTPATTILVALFVVLFGAWLGGAFDEES